MNAKSEGLAAYVAITAAYWAFMLTDGALRMLVLLHFNRLGFSPVQLAYLFLLYEFAGMVTNLTAGWIAARIGLTKTLFFGLGIQIFALLALAFLNADWTITISVMFVMGVQGISGVAKDLAKMSSKSAVKLLAPSENGGLFRWVALLTGSKNAVKGAGFLLGAGLLALFGFNVAVLSMALGLTAVLIALIFFMPGGLPFGKKSAKFSEVFSKDPKVNWLSAGRVFLFGARDVWFVVGIPVYFYSVWSDGTAAMDRIAFFQIGMFMAFWIIFYGLIQASAPKLLRTATLNDTRITKLAVRWVGVLTLIPAALAIAALAAGSEEWLQPVMIAGLFAFAVVFALNSALHSYLILAFTKAERVTMDVGFYYMSNAAGRFLGTLLSGLSYQTGGLALCLATAAVMSGVSWVVARRI